MKWAPPLIDCLHSFIHFIFVDSYLPARSQFVCDIIPEKYLKGLRKILLPLETKLTWGVDVTWVFRIQHPREI
jgi:hypothetical protein